MERSSEPNGRKSSVDMIVERLQEDISSMRLMPGSRISEPEIAAQFGVSRQPVRDAFSRLESMGLLRIRPRKATEVKRFSRSEIEKSRFVRAAVEMEVLRRAARRCTAADGHELDACLALQRKALARGDQLGFAQLDYDFHRAICGIAGVPFAFDVIHAEKKKVDRLCMLALSREDRMPQLIDDHARIAEALKAGRDEEAVEAGTEPLSRLDATIEAIKIASAAYFDDDD